MDYSINEGSTGFLECKFKDENGNFVTPTSLTYRIDDITGVNKLTPIAILADTVLVPNSYKYVITIDAILNIILNDSNIWEDRLLTLTFLYNGGKVGTQAFYFKVINLLVID